MEYLYILYAKYLGISFLQNISLFISVLALFKHLLYIKVFPFYKPLVVLK
jgi:hypothetical protein